MLNRSYDAFLGCDSDYGAARVVMYGAPFDSTTSYRPGARFGSRAIRSESFGIETYSPYLDRDLGELSVFDAGDLELPFGNPTPALDIIKETAAGILNDGKLLFMLGGEHLVTLGAVRAAAERYRDLKIIHLDAHTDLRDNYLGQPLSHATVMRRAWELIGDGSIYQFGIRSGEREEFDFAAGHTRLEKFTLKGISRCLDEIGHAPVYFTLDLDVLDPSVFPGTGTPEAGGVGFLELLEAIRIIGTLNVVACDITELCPPLDPSGISTAAACKVVRETLLSLKSI